MHPGRTASELAAVLLSGRHELDAALGEEPCESFAAHRRSRAEQDDAPGAHRLRLGCDGLEDVKERQGEREASRSQAVCPVTQAMAQRVAPAAASDSIPLQQAVGEAVPFAAPAHADHVIGREVLD